MRLSSLTLHYGHDSRRDKGRKMVGMGGRGAGQVHGRFSTLITRVLHPSSPKSHNTSQSKLWNTTVEEGDENEDDLEMGETKASRGDSPPRGNSPARGTPLDMGSDPPQRKPPKHQISLEVEHDSSSRPHRETPRGVRQQPSMLMPWKDPHRKAKKHGKRAMKHAEQITTRWGCAVFVCVAAVREEVQLTCTRACVCGMS